MEEPLDDNSFEGYLKGRLQDFEADPAENAWDNIFAEISQEYNAPVRKRSWLGRSSWLLLVLALWTIPYNTHDIVSSKAQAKKFDQLAVNNQGKQNMTKNEQKGNQPKLLQAQLLKKPASIGLNSTKAQKHNYNNISQSRIPITSHSLNNIRSKDKKVNTIRQSQSKLPLTTRQQKPGISAVGVRKKTVSIIREKHKSKKRRLSYNEQKNTTIVRHKDTKKKKSYTAVSPLKQEKLPWLEYVPYTSKMTVVKVLPKERRKSRNLFIRAFISPTINNHRLITNKEDEIVIQDIEKNSLISGQNLGYSGGIMLETQLSKRWRILWGVSFTQLNDQINYRFRKALPDSLAIDFVNESRVQVTPIFNVNARKYRYKYQDLGVQLGANYWLFGNDWKHHLSLGVSANRATKTITQTDDQIVTENTSRIQALLNIGYEARFQFNKRMAFYLMPTFNYYLNTINQANTAYKVKPYFTGLRLGLIWRLR